MEDFTFTLAATNDNFVEGQELYTVSLSNPASTSGVVVTLDTDKNIVTTTINDTQFANGPIDGPTEWSLTGTASLLEGAAASYDINLTGNLQANESVSVQLTLTNLETSTADYATFSTAVDEAVSAYNMANNPGTLAWDGTNLTFTSDGSGPMATLTVSLATNDDLLGEGPERYRIDLANAASSTGLSPVLSSTENSVTTTPDVLAGFDSETV